MDTHEHAPVEIVLLGAPGDPGLSALLKEAHRHYIPNRILLGGDPDRLHQIVTNLVHNAHKFTPDHGRILVTASPEPPNHILLSIADSGPGIPQEALPRLFQAFYQAHRRPEIGTEGLGLGLSIVKQLVELHGATITVESTVGVGTTFHIRFPKIASPATSALI
jgi:signal transduction histidine kinase